MKFCCSRPGGRKLFKGNEIKTISCIGRDVRHTPQASRCLYLLISPHKSPGVLKTCQHMQLVLQSIVTHCIELLCPSLAASKVLVLCSSAVISPASWREGQKLVKLILGPVPKQPGEDRSHQAGRLSGTGGTVHCTCQNSPSYVTVLVIFMIPTANFVTPGPFHLSLPHTLLLSSF